VGVFAFWTGVVAALMTSFYSWRLVFLTFFGKARWAGSEHIQHAVHDDHGHGDHGDGHHDDGTAGYHPHESPVSMLIPLAMLTLGAVFSGYLFSHAFLDSASFWQGSVFYNQHLMHAMHEVPLWVKLSATVVMLLGLTGAWYCYIRNPAMPAKIVEQIGVIYKFVYNKWYFDELYNVIFIRPAFWLGDKFWKLGDIGLIDRFGPNGSAWAVVQGSKLAAKFQSGYLYSYALVMLLGLTAAISWVVVK
jgi:NADH-quinone oxidoreductase subunit L